MQQRRVIPARTDWMFVLSVFFFIAINGAPSSYLFIASSRNDSTLLELVAIVFLGSFNMVLLLVVASNEIEKPQEASELFSAIEKFFLFVWFVSVVYMFIVIFAAAYWKCGVVFTGPKSETAADDQISKADMVYFSVTTWTTLGFGDFIPSKSCRPWTAAEALTGYSAMALLIASLIAVPRFPSRREPADQEAAGPRQSS